MINADFFRIAQRFTRPDDPKRPLLAGVLIDPCPAGGVVLVATSGFALCAIWDPLGYTPVPLCVRVDIDEDWGDFRADNILAFDGPLASIRSATGETVAEVPYESFDAFKFPKWKRLFPDGERASANNKAAFDLQLLESFAFDGDVDAVGMWAYDKGAMAARLVTHDRYPTFIGAVMPIKVDSEHMFKRPVWLGDPNG